MKTVTISKKVVSFDEPVELADNQFVVGVEQSALTQVDIFVATVERTRDEADVARELAEVRWTEVRWGDGTIDIIWPDPGKHSTRV